MKAYTVDTENLTQRFGASKMHLRPPGGLGWSPFYGGGSVVVDLLLNVHPIGMLGFCIWWLCIE